MNLTRKGVIGRWYYWNYKNYPHNFCAFFWKLLFTIPAFPITIITVGQDDTIDSMFSRIGHGLITWFFLIATTWCLTLLGTIVYMKFLSIVLGLAYGIGVIAILLLIIVALLLLGSSSFASETWSIVTSKKSSVMDKYCPKIEWK